MNREGGLELVIEERATDEADEQGYTLINSPA